MAYSIHQPLHVELFLHKYNVFKKKKVNKVDKFWGGSHVTLAFIGESCLLLFLLSISTTSSRPSLYSSDFYSLFLFIYFSLVSYFLFIYFSLVNYLIYKELFDGWFCTQTSISWPSLYILDFYGLICLLEINNTE